MRVHIHPEGWLYIRDANDSVHYVGTLEEFKKDYGALPELPEGMVEMLYDSDTKIKVFYDKKGNAFPIEGIFECKHCEDILASKEEIVASKAARNKPPAPPKHKDQEFVRTTARRIKV